MKLAHFHERAPFALARILVKLAILLKIRDASTLAEKILLAQSYAELHCNVRVSETAADLLVDAATLARGVLGGKSSELSEVLRKFVNFKHLKSTQRDDVYECLGYFAG